MSLRPIGTEFWHEFPVVDLDTRGEQDRFLYKIVAHSRVGRDKKYSIPTETLVVVRHQIRKITGYKPVRLSDRTILDFVFGEWQEK